MGRQGVLDAAVSNDTCWSQADPQDRGGGSAMHGNQVANGPGVPTSSVVGQNGQCNIVLDV
jgi:hypothetical protein